MLQKLASLKQNRLSVPSRSALLTFSYLRLVVAVILQTTAEKYFVVELYFRSYRIGHAGGPSVTQCFTFSGIFSQKTTW